MIGSVAHTAYHLGAIRADRHGTARSADSHRRRAEGTCGAFCPCDHRDSRTIAPSHDRDDRTATHYDPVRCLNVRAGRAGTSTRRSTTGRTRGRSADATCRSGGAWRRRRGGPVLELGCGTGRISLPLARAGVSVVGIDRSEPMLAPRRGERRSLARTRRAPRHRLRARARRHPPLPFAPSALRDGARAVRHPAVAVARYAISTRRWTRSPACWRPADSSASTSSPMCRTGASTRTASRCAGARAGGAHLTLDRIGRQDRAGA